MVVHDKTSSLAGLREHAFDRKNQGAKTYANLRGSHPVTSSQRSSYLGLTSWGLRVGHIRSRSDIPC